MAVVPLKTNQQVDYSVIIKDATGANARVQSPKWDVTGPVTIKASNPPSGSTPPPVEGAHPEHPIVIPPDQPQPPDPNAPHPEHPIVIPPPGEPQPPQPPGGNPPPQVTHPDVGIPRPQPVGAAKPAGRTGEEQPYTCTVAAKGGETGAATVIFSCDADMGEGVKPVMAVGTIVVSAGEAVVVELEPGTPTDQEGSTPEPVEAGRSRSAR